MADRRDIILGVELNADEQRRIDALTSLAKMEMRLVWIGDHILRIARWVRHPFRHIA